MPGPAASATSVGAGSPRGGGTSSPRAGGGGGARQRKGTSSSGAVRTTRAGGTSSGGMWRFYTDDSPGIKVRMMCRDIYNSIELSVRISSLNYCSNPHNTMYHLQHTTGHLFTRCLQVGPVPVLVMSLLFIACVFMLHIWGKYNRA